MAVSSIYKKRLFYLIVICTAIRIIAACAVELGNDEVYYYTYAMHLQENYFDHPPGVALLIKLFTLNLAFQQAVFIRLGSIVCAIAGTFLSFKIGTLIRNEQTGWLAAVLYSTNIYSSVIAGTFILPDSPQIVFWLASLLVLIKIIGVFDAGGKVPLMQWVLFGVFSGVCIMCKVHGAFLWFGLGLYILFFSRKMFMQWGMYLAFLITLLIISPIFFWNIQNDFVTWDYHSSRVAVHQFVIDGDGFIQTLVGQLFYNNPVNVIITVLAVIYFRKNEGLQKNVHRLLLLCGLPIIFIVTGTSLFNTVLPHWSGPGFITLSFLAAAFLDIKLQAKKAGVIPLVLKSSSVLIIFLIAAGIGIINFYPGTIGSKDERNYGESDFSLDMNGWGTFGAQFNQWKNLEQIQQQLQPDLKIVCNKWFPASHINYYVARPSNTYVVGVGSVNDLHQFVWLNHYQPALKKGENALCIVPSNYPEDPSVTYRNSFASDTLLHTFKEYRGNKLSRYFDVYLLKGYESGDEAETFKIGQ